MIGVVVTAVATAWLVVATRSGHSSRFLAKPIASLGFLLVAVTQATEPGARTTLVVIGLVLGAIGDVALMGRSDVAFLAGLVSFLLGHVAYAVAFGLDVTIAWLLIGSLVAITLAVTVSRWLRPHLEPPFTVAVPVYVLVISTMVATGVGSAAAHPLAAVGAVLFAASDVAVARERFVVSARANATVGLPLYYAAQLVIAWSVVAA